MQFIRFRSRRGDAHTVTTPQAGSSRQPWQALPSSRAWPPAGSQRAPGAGPGASELGATRRQRALMEGGNPRAREAEAQIWITNWEQSWNRSRRTSAWSGAIPAPQPPGDALNFLLELELLILTAGHVVLHKAPAMAKPRASLNQIPLLQRPLFGFLEQARAFP